jgi:hypothetical protein
MVSTWPASAFAGPLAVRERSPQFRARGDREPPVACLEPPAAVEIRTGPGGQGPGAGTVTRRLCAIAGFYRYAVEEELLDHSQAAHVRRPPD